MRSAKAVGHTDYGGEEREAESFLVVRVLNSDWTREDGTNLYLHIPEPSGSLQGQRHCSGFHQKLRNLAKGGPRGFLLGFGRATGRSTDDFWPVRRERTGLPMIEPLVECSGLSLRLTGFW